MKDRPIIRGKDIEKLLKEHITFISDSRDSQYIDLNVGTENFKIRVSDHYIPIESAERNLKYDLQIINQPLREIKKRIANFIIKNLEDINSYHKSG